MPRYDLWTHGSAVIVENPALLQNERRWGFGSIFSQAENTQNWFHFPIPTLTVADDNDSVALRYLRVRALTNENARVEQLTVHEDNSNRIHDETPAAFLIGNIDHRVGEATGTIKTNVDGSIVLSVRVSFLTGAPNGEIRFHGAGARFDA